MFFAGLRILLLVKQTPNAHTEHGPSTLLTTKTGMVKKHGGVVETKPSEVVTHVVAADGAVAADAEEALRRCGAGAVAVQASWLNDCARYKKLLPPEKYALPREGRGSVPPVARSAPQDPYLEHPYLRPAAIAPAAPAGGREAGRKRAADGGRQEGPASKRAAREQSPMLVESGSSQGSDSDAEARCLGVAEIDLLPGKSIWIVSDRHNSYMLTHKRSGEYMCTCPSFEHGADHASTDRVKTCKHLKAFRGEAAELLRVQAGHQHF